MDVLDEIQYRSGNEDVRRLASTLTDEIFAEDEAVDNLDNYPEDGFISFEEVEKAMQKFRKSKMQKAKTPS